MIRGVLNLTGIFWLTIFAFCASAQNRYQKAPSGFSLGIHLNLLPRDFGVGMNITSPYFVNSKIAARVSTNYQWFQTANISGSPKWALYNNVRAGFIGVTGFIGKSIRVYGEGGLVVIIPNTDASDKITSGGYGQLGFEFFLVQRTNSFFIEIGGIGTGAMAEKLNGAPMYSNGLLTGIGFRLYPGKMRKLPL